MTKTIRVLLQAALAVAIFWVFAAATSIRAESAPALLATDTRWPTVTRRPSDTRWQPRPTDTRWPTATRRITNTPAFVSPTASPTTTRTSTVTPPPVQPSNTPGGIRPTDTRWLVRPTDTRWPTVTRRATNTPAFVQPTHTPTATRTASISPTNTPLGFRPSNTPWGFRPTATRWPTLTVRPTDTRWPTITSRFSATPSRTATATLTPTETRAAFSEGPFTIGYSVQGRSLDMYRFGTGPVERLIVAGIHGGSEYNTIQLADQLINYIKSNPQVIPQDVTLFILRSLNPDGAARARNYLGRTNANNVDLNRNWDANWQADWPRAGCWNQTYTSGGTGPASEPETQALMAFILDHNISAIINYHSAALGIFAGGVPDYPPSFRLADAVAAVTTYPWPPLDTGCVYTGGMVDWTAAQGIPSLDVELTNHTNTDFTMNLRVLNVFVNWR